MAFPVWIFNWPSCICCSAVRRQSHHTSQKTISFRKCREEARGTVALFVLPSKPACLVACSNGAVSSSVLSNCSVCAQVSHAHSVHESVCALWGISPPSLSPAVWHRHSSLKASDVVFRHIKAWELMFVLCGTECVLTPQEWQVIIDFFPKIDNLA